MSADIVASHPASETVTGSAFGRKGIGWAIFEWARNPYFNLIVIYIFAAYFANTVVGDPVEGQVVVARVIAFAGFIMVPTAPVLGAIVDKAGPKKPFLAFVLGLLALCAAGLWFITPDLPAAVPIGMVLLTIGYCSYTVSELLHNSMLHGAGAPKSVPMISGLGLALGNAAGLLLLILIFWNPMKIDQATLSRLTGPIVAVWLAGFSIFFFWLMPDVFRKGQTWRGALRDLGQLSEPEKRFSKGFWPLGFALVKPIHSIVTKFKKYPNVMKYLLARMIWADALQVLYAVGVVYVAGVLSWSIAESTMYGIIASIFAVSGGFVGGFLDQRLGPKRALSLEIIVIMILLVLQLSITQDSLFFGLIPVEGVLHEGTIFNSLSDVTYLALTIPNAIMIVACITSSRYMLVHIAPPEKIGEFFGFYAMVGSATIFLGPALLALVTDWTNSQRWGMASIIGLFIIGLTILQFVESGKTPSHIKNKSADPIARTGA